MRVNPVAATNVYALTRAFGGTAGVARLYLFIASAPILNETVLSFTAAGVSCGIAYDTLSAQWYPAVDDGATLTLGSAGVTLATSTWHLIDLYVNVAANPWTVDVQTNGAALTQHTAARAATTIVEFIVGNQEGRLATYDLYYDDLIISLTSADYPIGAGKVTPHAPNRDGTHTFTSTNAKRSIAGTTGAITVTSTNVWQVLDDLVSATNLGASDWAVQETSAAAQYLEVGFASTTDTTNGPRAVELVTANHHLTTAAANNKLKLLDNGTTQLFYNRATSGNANIVLYNTTQYASMVGGGAWTKARFDAVQIRWGYSTDANPDVFLDAALIEAEFAIVAAGPTTYVVSATAMNGTGTLSGTIAFVRSGIAAAI